MRLRIDCAYDGAEFSGWATQPGRRTVQGTLEAALATALRVPEVRVTVAGRTDAGVHARGQVAHVDVDPEVVAASAGRSTEPPLQALARRVDGILPPDLRVRRVVEAPEGFDARFSAVWRRYAYRVADAQELADPLVRGHVLTWGRPLDLDAMNEASAPLVGLRTSPPSASSGRGRPPSARCSTSTGGATTPGSSSARCAPTPSATTWCAPWSAASSRSARAGSPPGGRPR